MDLVGQQDVAGLVDAELVLGVGQDQAALGREVLAAKHENEA